MVITQGTTHLGILPWISGIIGLLQSHFDVNNISNFPVILHWSFTAVFCPKKQKEIECLKLEMWRVHFIQVVWETAHPERCNIIRIDSVLCYRQFLSPIQKWEHEMVYTLTDITFNGHCRIKEWHYDFSFCYIMPLQGQVFIRLFAFNIIPFINPACFVTIWHLFSEWCVLFYVWNYCSFLCYSPWPSPHWFLNLLFYSTLQILV